jgi:uncharacterized membrane protein YgdD (TMEM256/DUF423 family)
MSWIRVAAALGFAGVLLGAFGAHALRGRVADNLLSAYQTGVLYHLIHTVVLLALALHAKRDQTEIRLPASLLLAGIVLFSGSLYLMALSGITRFAIVTPVGGLCFLAGWVAIFVRVGRR